VLDAEHDLYLEVPYRGTDPPVDHTVGAQTCPKAFTAAAARRVNEAGLFAAIDDMREIERQAIQLTRSARRNRTRRASLLPEAPRPEPSTPIASMNFGSVDPFEDIESW
jgi:putative transposase